VDLDRLIELLTDPRAYPHHTDPVEVHQTHISAVFLAGGYAYKVKKPMDLGFLDFTTLEKRHFYCLEEVRLNRRLAPGTYLGVLPVAVHRGEAKVDGEGQVAEWVVWMKRLPAAATLKEMLSRGEATPELFDTLARHIAAFHARAQGGDEVAAGGRWGVVARNARENFEQSTAHVGNTIHRAVFNRFRALTEAVLNELRPIVEERARRGVPRDTHGDLHLDHVYAFADRPPPDDLVIVDCIEFNERFRYADPVADAAFLVMDLERWDRRDFARRFADAYFDASGDDEGPLLLPFYKAYRAAVRGKVAGFEAVEAEVPDAERNRALDSARAHWLLGLCCLEEPGRRPCLICVGGPPGTGKSTLARGLQEKAGFTVISTDAVRKELARMGPLSGAASPFGEGLYTEEWNERTYLECRRRVEQSLFRGERVLVDASFRVEARRAAFLETAHRWGVTGRFLMCQASPEQVRARLAGREGDVSDADWGVYVGVMNRWQPPSATTRLALREVRSGGELDQPLQAAMGILADEGLV
jgi:aminoglycoside phosphotransferase family enzyme/predicted kinase